MRVLAVLGVLAVGLAGCAENSDGNSDSGDQSGPIKVGAVLDITGAGATLGVPERKALEMSAKQVNDAGGIDGRKVESSASPSGPRS